MTIYSFHLFDRNCDPSITHHFHRPAHNLSPLDLSKLIFGVVFSLRSTIRKLTPSESSSSTTTASLSSTSTTVNGTGNTDDGFFSYKTSSYALHVLETPSLLRFILLTSPDIPSSAAERILRQIYAGLYVEYILKNPLGLSALYHHSRIELLREHRFGPKSAQSKAQRRREVEITRRERGEVAESQVAAGAGGAGAGAGEGAGNDGHGWGEDVSMVMGCELFVLALEQFVQGLPGYV